MTKSKKSKSSVNKDDAPTSNSAKDDGKVIPVNNPKLPTNQNDALTLNSAPKSRKVAQVPTQDKAAFEELLIYFVKDNKQLWDSGAEGYKDKNRTDTIFKQFIKENSLDSTLSEVKQSWQSLRSAFNRKRKEIRDKGK